MPANIGVKLQIEGFNEYKKNIDTIAQQQKTLQAEYNKTTSTFDKNTSSQEKNKAKVEALTKQQELQQKKVDELQKVVDVASKSYDENSKEMQSWKEKLAQAETELNKINRELEDNKVGQWTSQLQDAGKKLEDIGGKMSSLGDSLTKNVTTPILAVGTASMASWAKVDEGLDIVIQKTGATGDALEEMQGTVKNIAKTVPSDWKTIGTAVGEVNTRFGVTGQELEDLSSQFIQFAQINGTDVNSSIDSVQKALTAFGLSANDAGSLLDAMNKVGQDTGISMATLSQSMLTNATSLQEMGLNAEQAVAFLGQVEVSGADVTTIMSGLGKALKSATADGIPFDEALKNLQHTILDNEDATEGLQMAYDLFGRKGDQVFKAVQNGTIDFEALASTALDSGDSVANTFDAMLDPADKWQLVLNQLMELGYEIGEALMPAITSAVETLMPILQSMIDAWNNLSPEMQDFIVKGALATATIGPLFKGLGNVTTGIGKLLGGSGGTGLIALISKLGNGGGLAGIAGVATKAFGVLSSSGLLPIIGVVSAVVGAGVLLYQNWDKIKETAINVKNGVVNAWNNLKTSVSDIWNGIKNTISGVVDKIKGLFNFSWSFPKIKLPHFGWTWESIGGLVSIPKISVEWYKKGYNNALVFDKPTVIPTSSGLKGFGDGVGSEFVMGQGVLTKVIKQAVGYTNSTNTNNSYGDFNVTVVAKEGSNNQDLVNMIERQLYDRYFRKGAVWNNG